MNASGREAPHSAQCDGSCQKRTTEISDTHQRHTVQILAHMFKSIASNRFEIINLFGFVQRNTSHTAHDTPTALSPLLEYRRVRLMPRDIHYEITKSIYFATCASCTTPCPVLKACKRAPRPGATQSTPYIISIVAFGAAPAAEAASAASNAERTAHDALCAGQCVD